LDVTYGVVMDHTGKIQTMNHEKGEYVGIKIHASPLTHEYVFVRLTELEPKDEDGGFNRDLYLFSGGVTEQITNLKTMMVSPRISYSGKRMLFLADKNKRKQWDVWYIDKEDKKPHLTSIREKLIALAKKDRDG